MRWLLWLLLGALPSAGGEHRHFEMPVGPGGRSSTVHAYVFSSKDEMLQVIDQGNGKTPLYQNLGAACEHANAFAGINAGPSDGEGQPLGMVIAGGVRTGVASLDRPETAGLVAVVAGKPVLKHAAAAEFSQAGLTDLVQSGPFLVEDGKAAANLQPSRFARRSFIVTDGKDRWALAFVPGATLDGLAKALATPGAFAPFTPQAALNLGGNTASGFWVQRSGGYLFYLKEIVPVRNFLIVTPRR